MTSHTNKNHCLKIQSRFYFRPTVWPNTVGKSFLVRNKSTACLAWRRFHIFEGNSINSQNGNKVRVKKDQENGGNSPSYNRIIISKSGNFPLYKQNPRQQPCVQRFNQWVLAFLKTFWQLTPPNHLETMYYGTHNTTKILCPAAAPPQSAIGGEDFFKVSDFSCSKVWFFVKWSSPSAKLNLTLAFSRLGFVWHKTGETETSHLFSREKNMNHNNIIWNECLISCPDVDDDASKIDNNFIIT